MSKYFAFSEDTERTAERAEREIAPLFSRVTDVARHCSARVLAAFAKNRVSAECFAPSSGYGYDDKGRDTLDRVYADAFGAEDALVRPHFINGTHAIATALYGLLEPGDTMLSAAGKPYDTLEGVVGLGEKPMRGSLASLGVKYRQLDLPEYPDDTDYLGTLAELCTEIKPKVVFIQRSKGYSSRETLSSDDIRVIAGAVKSACGAWVVVDNCYGEFCDYEEPTFGQIEPLIEPKPTFSTLFRNPIMAPHPADVIVGSLIKNPGGGLAPTGGYVAGRRECVELIAERLTVPGIGREAGCNPDGWRLYYQGLFNAPHAVAEALKTAIFCAKCLELEGYSASPQSADARHDIIQSVTFGRPEPLLAFCRGIQYASPVDSFATPEPWAMPGYSDEVVMAAGAFVQGASIELSADAPMREPYTLFIQGGLTFETGRIGILNALTEMEKVK